MIKLFRKTRYKLMSQNQIPRYFKYAIGEILLQVADILRLVTCEFDNKTLSSWERNNAQL